VQKAIRFMADFYAKTVEIRNGIPFFQLKKHRNSISSKKINIMKAKVKKKYFKKSKNSNKKYLMPTDLYHRE
jgi:hypothetical protein